MPAAGTEARHSLLVSGLDAVFVLAMRRFHHSDFEDADALIAFKNQQWISVCIPTLNEPERPPLMEPDH